MYGVITGDVVGSTSSEGRNPENQFSEIEENLVFAFKMMQSRNWLGEGDFVFFRGDSFQCILPVERGLEALLLIKAALKGNVAKESDSSDSSSWSCRIALGIGEVTYQADQVSKSNGPAFQRSGRSLDEMQRDHFTAITTSWESVDEEFALICRYLDIIVERLWTPVSGQTAWIYLQEPITQKEMAAKLDIKQPAIHSRIHSAELPVIQQTIKRYKSIIQSHIS